MRPLRVLSRLKSLTSLTKLKDSCTEAVIIGSGPTFFDYSELSQFEHLPVLFINQMHQVSHFCPSPRQYFFSHHIDSYLNVSPTTVWIRRMYLADNGYRGHIETRSKPKNKFLTIDCQSQDIVADDNFFKTHDWLLDKNEVLIRNRFLALFGTITTAMHFAWFCGAKKLIMIGCNPYSGSVDHDPRIGGTMTCGPDMVHKNTVLLPRYLNIEVEHL
ncbi:MAG: hypothetical protein ACKOA8_00720 [Deltaproteobacteria bacterium]